MKAIEKLLLNNKSWVQERREVDPDFFSRLAAQQRPEFLWIGCSDSRVPANTITGTDPGEIFVHRNIANLCVPNDVNLSSVLQYAVDSLEVKHVIVCGHYGCGGVKASMTTGHKPPLDNWLGHLREVYRLHQDALDRTPESDRADRLCEWSIREQVVNLSRSPIIRAAWDRGGGPLLHGWVYGLIDGVLHQLVTMEPDSAVVHRAAPG